MEYSDLTLTVALGEQREQSVVTEPEEMIRLLVSLLGCWLALTHAHPSDQSTDEANVVPTVSGLVSTVDGVIPTIAGPIPTVGPSPFPLGPNPYVPGLNNPYYKYNPVAPGPAVPILTYSNEQGPAGTYSYSFTTADGKQVQEAGYLKDAYIDNNGEPQGTQVVQGSYAYISPEGTPIQVSYVADENGFRPSGVRFPADGKVLPPLPAFVDGRNISIFDQEYNKYNRFGAYNRNPYDPKYPFDPKLPYDPRRPYDARYPYDPRRPYDARYPYDPKRPYDARYPYDPKRQYDARYPYDPQRPFDARYPYDPKRPYDARYPYDPTRPFDARYPYDPKRPFDQRYPTYNKYSPFQPTLYNNVDKEELKKE